MAGKDEFDYGEELPRSLGGRVIAGLVIAIFLVSTFGTGIADTFFSVEGIKPVGEEARVQAQQERDARLWDGSLARLYESELRRHSVVREVVLPTYSFYKFVYLREASSTITVGKQHWMFLTDRIKLKPASDQALATSAANIMIAVDRRLRGNGVEFTMLPIPRKSWVARDLLPAEAHARHRVDDLLIDELIDQGVSTVDMRKLYSSADPEEIYFKLDAHWAPEGARLAAEQTARTAGILEQESDRLGKLRIAPPKHRRLGFGLLNSLGIRPAQVDLNLLDLREQKASYLTFEPELNKWFKHPTPTTPFALAGTSFSTQQDFARLLSHYSGRPIFDGAERARPHMATLGQVLEAYSTKGARLEHLFWEAPICTVFGKVPKQNISHSEAFGRVFQAFPPKSVVKVQQVREKWTRDKFGETKHLPRKQQTLLTVPFGTIAHSGDGVAALHISGELMDAPLALTLTVDGVAVGLSLEPGEFDVVLPIVARGPSAKVLQLAARPARSAQVARLRIDSAAVVHQAVGKAVIPLKSMRADSGTQLTPVTATLLGKRAAVGIRTDAAKISSEGLVVEIWTEGSATPREVVFEHFNPGGYILLDLGREAGKRLTSIVVRAAKGAPSINSASIMSGQLSVR